MFLYSADNSSSMKDKSIDVTNTSILSTSYNASQLSTSILTTSVSTSRASKGRGRKRKNVETTNTNDDDSSININRNQMFNKSSNDDGVKIGADDIVNVKIFC